MFVCIFDRSKGELKRRFSLNLRDACVASIALDISQVGSSWMEATGSFYNFIWRGR